MSPDSSFDPRTMSNNTNTTKNSIDSLKKVAIIGAGVSGVLCGSVLKEDGHDVTLFEKSSRIGGIWAEGLYPGARLQNVLAHYHHPDFPATIDYLDKDVSPDYYSPTGPEIQEYFEKCAEHFDLNVKLNTAVVQMKAKDSGWIVTYANSSGGKDQREEEFDFVVIAQGHYSRDDVRIPWNGADVFCNAGGTILTRKQIADLSILKGKKVVVIGFGKTSVDMCTTAVEHDAKSVTHVFRSARCLIPRYIGGIHFTWLMFNRLHNELIPCWDHAKAMNRQLHKSFPFVFTFIWSLIQQVAWFVQTRSAWFVFDQEIRQRIKLLKSKSHILKDHRVAAALCPTDFFPYVTAGKILPVQGSIQELTPRGLLLEDGREVEADVILACIGVGNQVDSFPYFPEHYQETLIPKTGDVNECPSGLQLYRHMISPDVPNVAFMGWNAGFLHCVHSYLGSIWLSCMLRGEMTLPPEKEQRQVIHQISVWKRQHINYEPNLNSGVHTRLFHYNDTLMQDLGLSPTRKKGIVSELVARYNASDYQGVLGEIQNARNDQAGSCHEDDGTATPLLHRAPIDVVM